MSASGVYELPARRSQGSVVLVTRVGAATGAKAGAAAFAPVASKPDRAALLIDLGDGRAPRPTLIATAAARVLEERLAAHMPEAAIASRGSICHLKLPADETGIEQIAAALPLVRESAAIVHLPPELLRPVLEEPRIRPTAALLRADLTKDHSLTALATRDLMAAGLRVAVLKRAPDWLSAQASLLGLPLRFGQLLPVRMREKLFDGEDKTVRNSYGERREAQDDRQAIPEATTHAHEGRA